MVWLTLITPSLADETFDPELLEDTEIEMKRQPQEKQGKETPYLLYGFKSNKFFATTRDGLYSFIPTFTLQFRHDMGLTPSALTSNTFRLRRARLQMDGTLLTRDLKYEYDMELQTPREDIPAFKLQDFYFDYRFNNWAMFKLGQYKVPLSYQFKVSGIRQQFNERSIANGAFSPGRDIGILYHGQTPDKAMLYSLGVFNGEGQNRLSQNNQFSWFGQFITTPLGRYPTEESDVEFQEDPRVIWNVQGWLDQDEDQGTDQLLTLSSMAGFKWRGFSVHGHYYHRLNFQDTVQTLDSLDASGFYLQSGYYLIPHYLEAALRTAHVFRQGPGNDEHEYAVSFIYYFLKDHRLKFQTDYSLLQNEAIGDGESPITHRVLSQMQLAF